MISIAVIAVAFALVVLIHELGHYAAARILRFDVASFQVGFGPVLARRRDRAGVDWTLRLVPLFGFVSLRTDRDNPRSSALYQRPIWARILFYLSGPFASLVFGFGLILLSTGYLGSVVTSPVVSKVAEHAAASGIAPGDRIVSLAGFPIDDARDVPRILATYRPETGSVHVVLLRDGEERLLRLQPLPVEAPEGPVYRLGVAFEGAEVRPVGDPAKAIESIVGALKGLSSTSVSGPVGLGASLDRAADGGLVAILFMVGLFSFGMGVLNLLPIPVLDGGNIVLCCIEAVVGAARMTRITTWANIIGLSVIVYVLITATISDLQRLL